MDKITYDFITWCRIATSQIKYPPDRKAVYEELWQHLTDRYEDFLEQGLSEKEAAQKTLDVMGSAEELAPQLAEVHKPFWGFFLRTSRVLLVILLVLCCFTCWNYFSNLNLKDPNYRDFDVYDSASYGGDTGRTLLQLSEPGVSFSSDGSTFTLTDAAVFTEVSESDGEIHTRLYFRIDQTSLLPWSEHKEYYYWSGIPKWFCATDSLGNYYPSYAECDGNYSICIQPGGSQTGVFTYTHYCWINNFDPDAQWVDICYERDGRNLTMRIDLTGGVKG